MRSGTGEEDGLGSSGSLGLGGRGHLAIVRGRFQKRKRERVV